MFADAEPWTASMHRDVVSGRPASLGRRAIASAMFLAAIAALLATPAAMKWLAFVVEATRECAA